MKRDGIMRKTDREIKDFEDILDILRRCDTVRLGINGSEHPYVVPLSFGFEVKEGKLIIYIHGARQGFKHELLELDNRVCIEADICHRFAEFGGCITAEYESVIGFGRAEVITDENEANHGLELLLEHCGYGGFAYDRAALKVTKVFKIVLDSITGKRLLI